MYIKVWNIKGQVSVHPKLLPLHVPAIVDFIFKSTLFAQDEV